MKVSISTGHCTGKVPQRSCPGHLPKSLALSTILSIAFEVSSAAFSVGVFSHPESARTMAARTATAATALNLFIFSTSVFVFLTDCRRNSRSFPGKISHRGSAGGNQVLPGPFQTHAKKRLHRRTTFFHHVSNFLIYIRNLKNQAKTPSAREIFDANLLKCACQKIGGHRLANAIGFRMSITYAYRISAARGKRFFFLRPTGHGGFCLP